MEAIDVNIVSTGEWQGAMKAFRWMEYKMMQTTRKGIRRISRDMAKRFIVNLRNSGDPKFRPIAPFTRAVRRAYGIRSNRPGLATFQMIKTIKSRRINKDSYFAGIMRGKYKHRSRRGDQDMVDVAMILENGRPGYFMELDQPSPKTGKTPRMWLWWLYFQGVIKGRPSWQRTHLRIGPAPKRPFISQVMEKEADKIGPRLANYIISEFEKVDLRSSTIGSRFFL